MTRHAPVLSRTQVALYGLVAMFLGTILTGVARDRIAATLGRDPVVVHAAYGALVGTIFATLVATAVATRLADLSGAHRARWHRRHTLALTAIVVAYLAVAAVAPRLLGLAPAPEPTGLLLPGQRPGDVWAPIAAGAASLVVVGLTYLRFRDHGEPDREADVGGAAEE